MCHELITWAATITGGVRSRIAQGINIDDGSPLWNYVQLLTEAISVSTFSSEKQRFSIYIVVYEHDYK
jgi:hypothetical protein